MAEDVVISGSLDCSYCEMVEFQVLRAMRKESGRVQSLDLRKVSFV